MPLMVQTIHHLLRVLIILNNQVNGKVTAANTAVLRIRDLKEQIADRTKKANDAKVTAAGDALTERLTAVEGEIYQYRNRSSQDPLNFPIKLNNKLAALQGIVESGDFRPTDPSQVVFKELSAWLHESIKAPADSVFILGIGPETLRQTVWIGQQAPDWSFATGPPDVFFI